MSTEAELKNREQIEAAYRWDLEAMYPDEAQWEADFRAAEEKAAAFSSYAGRLGRGAVVLLNALRDRDEIWQTTERVYTYARMRRDEDNRVARYQAMCDRAGTLIAKVSAAMAFFTPELLDEVRQMGVEVAFVTLHVGLGTFRPVKEDVVENHKMHSEHYALSEETATVINRTRERGGRVIAVGTTSCRTLESVGLTDGVVKPGDGWTEIFIYPGYQFQVLDGLITNFHLPESTLIMLVSALAGYDHTMNAYEHAVEEKYRFFSFGDAMAIL